MHARKTTSESCWTTPPPLRSGEGAHFDAVKRGLALAAAGRSAFISTGTLSAAFDLCTRDALFLQLKTYWASIEPAFRLSTELSGTFYNTLWLGVTIVF